MKSFVLSGIAVLALSAGRVDAQRLARLQLEGGAALATVSGEDLNGFDPRMRVAPYGGVGLILHAPTSRVGLQTGVYFVGKGAGFDEDGTEGSVQLSYLEVPLLLRLAPTSAGVRPALFAGGTVAYRTGCTIEAEAVSVDCDDEDLRDLLGFRRVDAGVTVGAELAIPAGRRLLIVPTIRFTEGLVEIAKDDESNVKNRVLSLSVALRFRR